jgi:predicted Zn-dependent protease
MRRFSLLLFTATWFFHNSVEAQEGLISEKLGAIALENVKRTQGFYKNDLLLESVVEIGRKLEAQLEENDVIFKYYLIDSPEPNAFATAGGNVFITRGLLSLLTTEDELACVMAHEFIHVLEHHTEKTVYRNALPMILEVPGNMLGALLMEEIGQVLNFPITVTSETINSVFARQQEDEADKKGLELARKAGYNPSDFVSILERLQQDVDYITGTKAKFHLFDDHPLTSDRIERINKQLERMPAFQKASIPLVNRLDGVIIGSNPDNGIISTDNRFLHPDLNVSMELPENWGVEITPLSLTIIHPDMAGVLVFGADPDHKYPEDAAEAFRRNMDDRHIENDTLLKDPLDAYNSAEYITFMEDETISISTWIRITTSGVLIHVIGTAKTPQAAATIIHTLKSMRPLNPQEKDSILTMVLRVEKASEDETLESFLIKKNNEDNLQLMEIYNGMSRTTPVSGKFVKYIDIAVY